MLGDDGFVSGKRVLSTVYHAHHVVQNSLGYVRGHKKGKVVESNQFIFEISYYTISELHS